MSGAAPRVTWSRAGAVHTIRLARPERRNAIDTALAEDLRAAAEAVGDARVILLLADGDHFCVGGDVGAFADAPDTPAFLRSLADALHAAVRVLADSAVPVVAGVQGWAAGAGFSLVLGADVVVAGESVRFRPAYPGIGLSPDGGMTWLLPRLVGRQRALRMLYTDEVLTAAQALELGIVGHVVPDADVESQARALAEAIAAVPGDAVSATRRLVLDGEHRTLTDQLDAESASIAACSGHPRSQELVRAFVSRSSRPTTSS